MGIQLSDSSGTPPGYLVNASSLKQDPDVVLDDDPAVIAQDTPHSPEILAEEMGVSAGHRDGTEVPEGCCHGWVPSRLGRSRRE